MKKVNNPKTALNMINNAMVDLYLREQIDAEIEQQATASQVEIIGHITIKEPVGRHHYSVCDQCKRKIYNMMNMSLLIYWDIDRQKHEKQLCYDCCNALMRED